jgi:hypothetical protein
MQYPGHLIRRGELKKTIVKAVQQRLNELSIGSLTDNFSFEPLKVDGDYGIQTEKAVKLFQLNFTDKDGQPLQVDGVIGPATWGSLFGSATIPPVTSHKMPEFLKEVLEIASEQVGIRENPIGSNRGPKVDEYIRSLGLNPSSGSFPWCVAFVYWCFNKASVNQGRNNPVFKTAGVHELWNKSRNQAFVRRITSRQANNSFKLVQPGQIFCIDFGSGRGHVGLVESITNGKLVTIEGNTNVGGSREGVGVFRRQTRHIEQIDLGFIDYSNT